MTKEPSLEEMRKVVAKHVNADGLTDDSIRVIYEDIKKYPQIKRAEEDSLAGES